MFKLSQTEYPSCAVFLFKDLDTQRVFRPNDFNKAQLIRPRVAYRVAGEINGADRPNLVIESVPADAKHSRRSNIPVPDDGAGGSPTA